MQVHKNRTAVAAVVTAAAAVTAALRSFIWGVAFSENFVQFQTRTNSRNGGQEMRNSIRKIMQVIN